jgi:hypothetical protein
LARGEDVELRNFGIFEVRLTKERVGRNPNQPGSSFKIPQRATVKFKAGKIMRQKVSKLSAVLKQAEAVKTASRYPEDGVAPQAARSRPSPFKTA